MAGLSALPLPTQTGTAAWPRLPPTPRDLSSSCVHRPGPLSQQRQGKASLPVGETGQDTACTSSLAQGAPSTLLGSVCCTWQGHRLPQPRAVGSCYWCQTPRGTQPYTSALALPPGLARCPLQEKPHFMPTCPSSALGPLSNLRPEFWDTGE